MTTPLPNWKRGSSCLRGRQQNAKQITKQFAGNENETKILLQWPGFENITFERPARPAMVLISMQMSEQRVTWSEYQNKSAQNETFFLWNTSVWRMLLLAEICGFGQVLGGSPN